MPQRQPTEESWKDRVVPYAIYALIIITAIFKEFFMQTMDPDEKRWRKFARQNARVQIMAVLHDDSKNLDYVKVRGLTSSEERLITPDDAEYIRVQSKPQEGQILEVQPVGRHFELVCPAC